MPRDEPFTRLVKIVRRERAERAAALCAGQWQGEGEARELAGRIGSLDMILEQMKTIAGPGTDFGEEDV